MECLKESLPNSLGFAAKLYDSIARGSEILKIYNVLYWYQNLITSKSWA